ncbi:MAG: hypothetical protein QG652_1382, partial [Pseudomonadota bacterium]|nr:hypothetical protein [Pseudomonadota bacterium]
MSITVLKIPAHGSALSWTGQCGLLALGYFVTGKFGLMLPYIEPHITLLWLPTGLAVAALLRWGMAVWPGITLGVLALAWSMESEPGLALGIAAGNTLGPLLAAGLLRHYHFRRTLDQTRDIVLLVAAAVTGMLLSASGGVASLYIFDVIPANDTLFAWLAWWAGDSVGVLLATPLLLNMTYAGLGHIWQQKTEYVIWLALTCVLGWGIFIFNTGEFGHSLPLVFLMLPMVVWAAMRFDITGASAGTLACMLIAAWATSHGLGPFHRD